MHVKRYSKEYETEWNKFVGSAESATFMFHRSYMDYHSHRFEDHSLMVYEEEQIVALVPANILENTLYSHQGLSYGSFIVKDSENLSLIVNTVRSCLHFLQEIGVESLNYKSFPAYYDNYQDDAISYLLYILKAELVQSDLSTLVDLKANVSFQGKRLTGIKRARNVGLRIIEKASISDFWELILAPNLRARFDVSPTHSEKEMSSLQSKFPDNILQFNVYEEERIIAGATIYLNHDVIHTQYLSANERGRQIGALDFLIDYFINERFKNFKTLSFGISTYEQGRKLNKGLYDWKIGFGGQPYLMNSYSIDTKNYQLLDILH